MGASWKSLVASFVAAFINYFVSLGPNLPQTGADWGHAAFSAAIIAFGLVVKDWNVSNAKEPAAPTAVPPAAMATPNPAAVVKPVLMLLAVLMAGALTACSSLPSYLGGTANQLHTLVGVTLAGTYTVEIRKNGELLHTETWQCTTDGTKLTGCHKAGSLTVSPSITPGG